MTECCGRCPFARSLAGSQTCRLAKRTACSKSCRGRTVNCGPFATIAWLSQGNPKLPCGNKAKILRSHHTSCPPLCLDTGFLLFAKGHVVRGHQHPIVKPSSVGLRVYRGSKMPIRSCDKKELSDLGAVADQETAEVSFAFINCLTFRRVGETSWNRCSSLLAINCCCPISVSISPPSAITSSIPGFALQN